MELPVLGEISLLNAGIVGCTLLVALLLHLSMNAGGSSAGTRLDDGAFEALINDDADADSNGGWDDDGEVETVDLAAERFRLPPGEGCGKTTTTTTTTTGMLHLTTLLLQVFWMCLVSSTWR